nr:MAG TPA: hypothetical protein [Bacteriophage sp.]
MRRWIKLQVFDLVKLSTMHDDFPFTRADQGRVGNTILGLL